MKKTLQDIISEILATKESNPELQGLTSDSKTSIWRNILQVVAFAIYNFQLAAELHLAEIKELIADQKVFNLRRYQKETLRFQHGFDLMAESDQFKSEFYQSGAWVEATPTQIENSKIIKYAACNRVIADGKVRIILKIAPENMDEIFEDDVMTAFGSYIQEIAPAGDHVAFVNYLPDLLQIFMKIKYDPKVLTATGMHIVNANFPVQDAIAEFLKNLPFNGELSVQKLEAKILEAEGVDDLLTQKVETAWVNPGIGYGLFQPIEMSVIPESGRFKIENYNGISYSL
ncbi:nucleotidyltransferase [Amniculibacterium sp. G2-70]|uniref:nucleotidyltransferase n=1 Tax=Amniculibacterium sp. G2-70 TaxID=2767188 RepID=UPI0016543E88|nr:nucleotidyltransferase [Amniculibacterium sp. G2-70]